MRPTMTPSTTLNTTRPTTFVPLCVDTLKPTTRSSTTEDTANITEPERQHLTQLTLLHRYVVLCYVLHNIDDVILSLSLQSL